MKADGAKKRFSYIDALRGYAVLGVVLVAGRRARSRQPIHRIWNWFASRWRPRRPAFFRCLRDDAFDKLV